MQGSSCLFAKLVSAILLVLACSLFGNAQTLTTLADFSSTINSYIPNGAIAQDASGNTYGATRYGGGDYGNNGTIYKVAADGTLTVLHQFCTESGCTDGGQPYGGVIVGSDGNVYGTTYGNVFKITPTGDFTTLYTFCSQPGCVDGEWVYAPVVEGKDGNFYGVTAGGGPEHEVCDGGCGTVFKVTPEGVLTTLHSFKGNDGWYPEAGLVQGSDGNFYGTTVNGGIYKCGTAFKITPSGVFTLLHSFPGARDFFSLNLQASNGNFYGVSIYGGLYGDGSIFTLTPTGKYTVIHSFNASVDGENPETLLQGTDGNFYGVAAGGGSKSGSDGTIFKLTPSGKLSTLYQFCAQAGCTDGAAPDSLWQSAANTLVGATSNGGTNSCNYIGTTDTCGTVFQYVLDGARTDR